jgi:hypothetical protein
VGERVDYREKGAENKKEGFYGVVHRIFRSASMSLFRETARPVILSDRGRKVLALAVSATLTSAETEFRTSSSASRKQLPHSLPVMGLTLQTFGHAIESPRHAFIELLLGQADRLRQLEAREPQTILGQRHTDDEQHSQLRLPTEDPTSQRQILLAGRAEFEPDGVGESPDLVEAAIDRLAKRGASRDVEGRILSKLFLMSFASKRNWEMNALRIWTMVGALHN